MTRVKVKLGYEDYAAIDDGQRYELIDGELCMVPAPTTEHQRISRRLLRSLDDHASRLQLGEVLHAPLDVILSRHDVLQPDLLFIAKPHGERLETRGLRGAPDLAIEILSPGTAKRDRGAKATIYHHTGVREIWFVDPEAQTIEVCLPGLDAFRLDGRYQGDQPVRSTVLPELELRAGEAFAD